MEVQKHSSSSTLWRDSFYSRCTWFWNITTRAADQFGNLSRSITLTTEALSLGRDQHPRDGKRKATTGAETSWRQEAYLAHMNGGSTGGIEGVRSEKRDTKRVLWTIDGRRRYQVRLQLDRQWVLPRWVRLRLNTARRWVLLPSWRVQYLTETHDCHEIRCKTRNMASQLETHGEIVY